MKEIKHLYNCDFLFCQQQQLRKWKLFKWTRPHYHRDLIWFRLKEELKSIVY